MALPGVSSTAVMPTNTAQFAVDAATSIRGRGQHADLSQIQHRARLTLASLLGFVVGLMPGAILEVLHRTVFVNFSTRADCSLDFARRILDLAQRKNVASRG